MKLFKPICYKFKPMSRQILVHYIAIGLLLLLSASLLVKTVNNKKETQNSIYAVPDSTQSIQQQNKEILLYDREQDSDTFGYEKLIGSLIALGFAWLSYKSTTQHTSTKEEIRKYQEENIKQHDEIKVVLTTVIEQANKENVVKELESISKLITSLVEDTKCQILLDSIGARTQRFVLDTMTDELTPELYDYSVIKINSRCAEGIRQIKDMGFGKEFQIGFIKLQDKYTEQLKLSLHDIMVENKVNHKYVRFGGVVKTFLKDYSRDVVKLHGLVERA